MNVFLETCLDKPSTFTLTDGNGGARNTVTIAAKYIPIDMQILPRESINNSGSLRVELIDAKGIPAADRSGKSDPCESCDSTGPSVALTSRAVSRRRRLSPQRGEGIQVRGRQEDSLAQVGRVFRVSDP